MKTNKLALSVIFTSIPLLISLLLATLSQASSKPAQQTIKASLSANQIEANIQPAISKAVLTLKTKGKPLHVNGTLEIYIPNSKQENLGNIELAERLVYLQDYSTNTVVDKDLTQLDGKFNLTAPGAGKYQVCWDVENIDKNCDRPFSLKENKQLGSLVIYSEYPFAYGDSLLHEDRPCWLHDPFFEVDLFTEVSIFNTAGNLAASPVKANVSGKYVIGLPSGDHYRLKSVCEKTVYKTPIWYSAGLHNIDLPLDNWVPHKEELAAFLNDRGVTRAPANEILKTRLLTSDKDGDPLEFTWRTLDGSGNVSGSHIETEEWALPATPGRHQIYVMARDYRGGYLIETLPIQVGVPLLDFSGIVIDEVTRQPINKARITSLGVSTTTDDEGWFSMKVPELSGEQRYPLNINHNEYATYSRILHNSSRGNTYELIQAQVTYHDPSLPIDIIDTQSSGPCGYGDPKRHSDHEQKEEPRKEKSGLYQKAEEMAQRKYEERFGSKRERDCERRGARLQLPANSLVYADQSPAKGPISLSMATLNPGRRSLVGDYRAIDANNDDVELVSFGALFGEFRDVYGNKVNIKNGEAATLTIPVSNDQASLAQPTIPMWSYDEETGFWVEELQGQLQNTGIGLAYVGKTTHFSTINMDVSGNDPAVSTCVRLELGASLNAWSNLTLRAYVPVGGNAVQVKETALDNAQYHAIYRIPYSNPPAPPFGNTLRLELRGELPSGEDVVLLNEIIQTDLRPKMTGTDLWPDYPYTECGTPIVLEADPVDLPYYGDIAATGKPAFLTGPYGSYLPVDGVTTSTNYYATIDPASQKTTLGDWWTQNGFAADGSGGTRASYMNHNDLGFGRDMHCVGNTTDYACYVTNYGLPDQNPSNADDAVNQNPATQGATVTMEYHQTAGDTDVSFYAYNGGVAAAPRITFADLDGLGPKPIPHLCMVCHGGEPSDFDVDNLVHDAAFREFDLPSFKYSGNRSWDFGSATLTNTELTNFRTLNTEVAAIHPGSKIAAVINGWYNGGGNAPQQLSNAEVPASWAGEEDTYRDLYATTCRTCHIARGGPPETFGSFEFSDYTVCNQPRRMPNAYITYKNFWSDLIRVSLFELATGNPNCFD